MPTIFNPTPSRHPARQHRADSAGRHPCFDSEARRSHSRIHLPVAPGCNVQCRFCNRRYDCINESRPGVSSGVLRPDQALWYLDEMLERDPSISVVGIAGPGDPFAQSERSMDTLRRVRAAHPDLLLCVASNGLGIHPHIAELARLGVSHVTITVNAVEVGRLAAIYRWIRDGDDTLSGRAAGQRLLVRQAAAIRSLKRHGITTKINSIVIPGVNDDHMLEIAHGVRDLGADLFNIMSLHPVPGTDFGHLSEPDPAAIRALRSACEQILPQMPHCSRCRADAVGRIGCGNHPDAANLIEEASTMAPETVAQRPYVAVCSMEGMLVNQHLGHAETLLIYAENEDHFDLVDVRPAPPPGGGDERWHALVATVSDCRAVVASAAGPSPEAYLNQAGIGLYNTEGLIADALECIFSGDTAALRQPSCNGPGGGCSTSCSGGTGNACA